MTGNPETLRVAVGLIDQLQRTWRGRINRIDDLLDEPEGEDR